MIKNSSLWCKVVNNFEKWKASGNHYQIKYKVTGAIYEQDSNVVSFWKWLCSSNVEYKHDFYNTYVHCPSLYVLYAWASGCLFVSNKGQTDWTDRAQILCGTSHVPKEGLKMIKISKICLQRNTILIKFWKSRKFFHKIPKHFFVLLYNV